MEYRIKYHRKWGAYMVYLVDATGHTVQSAGWWGADELTFAHRWGRAAVACYNR